MSVLEGESATFTCEILKESAVYIDINWIFNGDEYDECGSTDIAPGGNGCYTNDTHSILLLRNISSLVTGSYPVQCILQQNIQNDFKNDPSFEESLNNITRSASLTITEPRGKLIIDYRARALHAGIMAYTCKTHYFVHVYLLLWGYACCYTST